MKRRKIFRKWSLEPDTVMNTGCGKLSSKLQVLMEICRNLWLKWLNSFTGYSLSYSGRQNSRLDANFLTPDTSNFTGYDSNFIEQNFWAFRVPKIFHRMWYKTSSDTEKWNFGYRQLIRAWREWVGLAHFFSSLWFLVLKRIQKFNKKIKILHCRKLTGLKQAQFYAKTFTIRLRKEA